MEFIKSKDVKYIDRNYRVEIYQDDCSIIGWKDLGDHFGTIYSNHRNWNPDNHRVEEILDEDNRLDLEHYVLVTIWMYEHSGTTIRANDGKNPFSCPWDSGCAGFIACSTEKIVEEYGELSEETIRKAKDVMIAEIHELDLVYQGDVYGYTVIYVGEDGEEEEIDSCCGIITEWNKFDFIFDEAEAEAIADAKRWYRINGIQLRIPFLKDDGEE